MTEAQITAFLTVADSGSFSKAAQKLYISQPAVSKQISQIENELGFALFDRTRNAVFLTEAGRLFYTLYTNFQAELNATIQKAKALSSAKQGEVRMGTVGTWSVSHIYDVVQKFFASRYPSVSLNWEAYTFDNMTAALRNGTVDVVFSLPSSVKDIPDLTTKRLTTVQSILLFSGRHPLAGKPNITLSDFKDEIFYIPASNIGNFLRASTVDLCSAAGFTPQISSAYSFDSILTRIQTNGGVTVTDSWMMAKENPQFSSLPLNCEFPVNICWLDNNANASKSLFVNEFLFALNQQDNKSDIWG